MTVALAGPVNAGKSSLMNALLGRQRAVVTEYPGTTRDFLEEPIQLAGLPVRLVDTAGLRETDNPAEAQGIQLGRSMTNPPWCPAHGRRHGGNDAGHMGIALGARPGTHHPCLEQKAILPPLPRTGMERGRTFP